MVDRDFKGVWIPREIWLKQDLSIIEKALFAEIDSLDREKGCFATNEYFADFFCVFGKTISRAISKLIKMKLIKQDGYYKRKRRLRSNLSYQKKIDIDQID